MLSCLFLSLSLSVSLYNDACCTVTYGQHPFYLTCIHHMFKDTRTSHLAGLGHMPREEYDAPWRQAETSITPHYNSNVALRSLTKADL
jgi:hypothetical protein